MRVIDRAWRLGAVLLLMGILCGCGKAVEQQESTAPQSQETIQQEKPGPAWEKHVRQEKLVIEGLEKQYDFLFLTDTHMVWPLQAAGEQTEEEKRETDYAAERYAHFQNAEGIASMEQFPEWMTYANEEQVDMVLLGGDIIDSPSAENIDHLAEQLSKLEVPYVYTVGNHDWTYPWEYMTEKGKTEYLPLLDPFTEEKPDIHVTQMDELQIVAIDNSSGQVPESVLEEYEVLLEEEKPMIVLLHVPLLTPALLEKASEVWNSSVVLGEKGAGGIEPNSFSEQFMDMTLAEDSPVELILAGHVHLYDRGRVEGDKDVWQIVGDAGYLGNATRIQIQGDT